jgi:large subunit ribosomal protein L13
VAARFDEGLMVKTTFLNAADVEGAHAPKWYVVDADGMTVGRLATRLATVLMGKHKPSYTPHVDTGDYVVVINADRVKFVGGEMAHPRHPYFTTKMARKTYFRHSEYPGGDRMVPAIDMWEKKPTELLRLAVKRMLPKNALARHMLDKLKLYAGAQHPHQAQQPLPWPEYLMP